MKRLILESLNEVSNLNEDRVLRKYVELMMATIRSNYFQQEGWDSLKIILALNLIMKKLLIFHYHA